jgi:sarcosine oxidase
VQRVDVVVVGAGAMGSSTAWWLARRGRSVALLEQFEQGHDRGSSHGSTRIFRLAYPVPEYVAMAKAALPLWRELEDDACETLLETTGAVDHGAAGDVAAVAAALTTEGVSHERMEAAEAGERWPGMRFDGTVLFHADGGRCLADRTVAALQRRAAEHGADVRFGTGPATLLGGGRVDAAGETWQARRVVVTAGAWLPKFGLDVALPPLRVTRERVQHFTPRRPGDEWPSFIHHRRPWVYGLLAPEGVKVATHMTGRDTDADEAVAPGPVDAAVVAHVESWFPGLDPTPRAAATCLYTTTPDETFVVARFDDVVVGSPCSGHGFKFTPLTGRRLADLCD